MRVFDRSGAGASSGVRFPEPLSPNMNYLKILAVLGLFTLVGTSSAVLLDNFGTISGTADVKEAVSIDRVDGSNGEVDLTRNVDSDFESGDGENDLDLVNSTDDDGSVLKDDFELKSDSKNVSVVLSGVTDVELKIGGNTVDEGVK